MIAISRFFVILIFLNYSFHILVSMMNEQKPFMMSIRCLLIRMYNWIE